MGEVIQFPTRRIKFDTQKQAMEYCIKKLQKNALWVMSPDGKYTVIPCDIKITAIKLCERLDDNLRDEEEIFDEDLPPTG